MIMVNVKLIYLLTGEQLLAEYLRSDEIDITVKRPIRVQLVPTQDGKLGIAVDEFMPLSAENQGLCIRQSAIVSIADPNDMLLEKYNDLFGNIKMPKKAKLIV